MKPFNLEEAINGKAFYLENGYRGVIKYWVDDYITQFEQPPNYPYIGYVLDNKGFLFTAHTAWNEHGGSNEYPSFNATTMVDDTLPQEKEQTMKPFDLEKALAGEPVVLRNGLKAYIKHNLEDYQELDFDFPLRGYLISEGYAFERSWTIDGLSFLVESKYDVIGMWEEPKLTTAEIMEKAFQEKLVVTHTASLLFGGFEVVGKTLDGDYILQNCDNAELRFLREFYENIEWSIVR